MPIEQKSLPKDYGEDGMTEMTRTVNMDGLADGTKTPKEPAHNIVDVLDK